MHSYEFDEKCQECAGWVVDIGEELVCSGCGVVRAKEVVEVRKAKELSAIDFTGQALGGYLGPIEASNRDRHSQGFSRSGSTYRYLKLMSDYAGREDSPVYTCAKLIERVSERLSLPNAVMTQAVVIAKKLLAADLSCRRVTLGTISVYSIVAACRINSVASVNMHEIVQVHREMGRNVTFSSLIQLSLSSPFKTAPRRPQDYVARVLAKLGMDPRLGGDLERVGINRAIYFNTLRQTTMEILESMQGSSMAGRRPCAIAATAVYAAEALLSRAESRRRLITQRQVAQCGDTAEYTVREQYRDVFMPTTVRVSFGGTQTLPPPRPP